MTRTSMDPDFDVRIADWLEDDPDRAPGPVLPTVVAAFPLITQRRPSRLPWRNVNMTRFALVGAAAAAIGVLLVGGTLFMLGGPTNQSASRRRLQRPSSTPSDTPRPQLDRYAPRRSAPSCRTHPSVVRSRHRVESTVKSTRWP